MITICREAIWLCVSSHKIKVRKCTEEKTFCLKVIEILLGNIACGEPILAEENIEEYIGIDAKANVDFALRCKGDSMINARIFDGDIVYIKQQSDVDDGEIAAVLVGTEATLKKVYKYENKVVLRPCNPMYDDMVYSDEQLNEVRILGKAIMFTSMVRHGK